ncbi:hypothetical protein ACS0TY_018913 [Phlomoides rotata]
MAIEARHLDVFRPQFIQDRELLNLMNQGTVAAAYKSQQMHFGFPSADELPENQAFYQQAVCDSAPAKNSVITDGAPMYNSQRKRSRDCFNQLYVAPDFPVQQKSAGMAQLPASMAQPPVFAGEMFPQIQQYQNEINAIINNHSKKIRMELEQRQRHQARLLTAAIGEGVMKKLREKDEQIQRLGKQNFVIQERVKSLHIENQLLRDFAQTSEATANSLRSNLERILLHIGGEERAFAGGAAVEEEDAESCCGSNDHGRDVEGAQDKEEGNRVYSDRKCKICDKGEASVLLLPCRHLCLCSGCGSGSQKLQACPVCHSSMTATLHVNMS